MAFELWKFGGSGFPSNFEVGGSSFSFLNQTFEFGGIHWIFEILLWFDIFFA